MGFRFHDTLSGTVRDFEPIEPGLVRMYNCGPTVYNKLHVGNYRPYTCWDVLRRALELGGHRVLQVVNVTDVGHLTLDDIDAGEDKMEAGARREGLDAWGLAEKYTAYFMEVWRKLRLLEPARFPRATAHVGDMVAHIEGLVRKGHAYVTEAGNVYFSVESFPAYGRLSKNTLEDLVLGSRVEVLPEKRHPADFALWKRDEKHQMQWDSPWGRGFPGWHIECSVMARKYLGDTLDIHTGGEDHVFPHHECEIAQTEALTGKPFANYWLHNRFLLVDGARMAKSKGTMYVMEDVEARGISHRALRYFLMSVHYRKPVNFTWEALEGAEEAVRSLDAMVQRLHADPERPDDPQVVELCSRSRPAFLAALQDDLNTSAALAVVHEFRTAVNRREALSPADLERVRAALGTFDSVLALDLLARSAPDAPPDPEHARLLAEREAARAAKDFARADALRGQLAELGIVVEDTPRGQKWRRA